MKRVLLLCLACMVLLSAAASAEIKKDKDETGLYVASTITKPEIGFEVTFTKNVVNDEKFYRVYAFAHNKFKENILKDAPISLLIDKYPSFDLEKYRYDMSKGVEEYRSSIQADIPIDLIEKVKNGKDVSLWCTGSGWATSFILLAPDFLDEWKEVINTEA